MQNEKRSTKGDNPDAWIGRCSVNQVLMALLVSASKLALNARATLADPYFKRKISAIEKRGNLF